MGIMLAILSFGFFIFLQNYFSYETISERNLLITVLLKARNQSVNNVCLGDNCTGGMPHGVKIVVDPTTNKVDKYVIFQGNTYDPNSPLNQEISSNYELFYTGNQSNSISEISFDQLSGRVNLNGNQEGLIELADKNNHTYTISINTEGRINW